MGKESDAHSDVVGEDKDIVAKESKAMTTRRGVNWARFRDVGTYEEPGFVPLSGDDLAQAQQIVQKFTYKKGRIEGYGTTAKAGETPPILPYVVVSYDVSKPLILEEHSFSNEQADTEADSLKLENASLKTTIENLNKQAKKLHKTYKQIIAFYITWITGGFVGVFLIILWALLKWGK